MQFDVDTLIPGDGKVRLVCNIVERMELSPLLCTYSRRGRKPVLDPVTFLKILLFCYSEGIFQSRKIEDFLRYDIRGHFLLAGKRAPDHSTICRFENILVDHADHLLTEFVEQLVEEGHVDLKSLYIDGTKMEAVAGRYTFVWRKSVEKNQQRLKERITKELGLPERSPLGDVMAKVTQEFQRIRSICSAKKIAFVYGAGSRKTPEQRQYEYFKDVKEKFEAYQRHLQILGDRNSYSKTDHDATFMRMKDDHMRNGQLKPAYNIQLATSGSFIVGVMGSQKANDLHTLKPFLEKMLPAYEGRVERIVADAGYESIENYAYLEDHQLEAYIKPSNHEFEKKKKAKEDIGRRENMRYLEEEDVYLCHGGRKLLRRKDQVRKSRSGYEDVVRIYSCSECAGCPHSAACIKTRYNTNPDRKSIQYSAAFELYRYRSAHNIASEEGINHRLNRSIQAEGAFSKIKDGLRYDRFRHRSMKKTVSDMILVAMGINLNKLHSKIQSAQTGVIEYKKTA